MKEIKLSSGKKVLASDPFTPKDFFLNTFVGRQNEMRMITAAWLNSGNTPPLCPLLVGEPGVGKNRLVYEVAREMRLPLYPMQGHEDLTCDDLACGVRFSDKRSSAMEYVLSPLVTAMHEGGICFIDEIGKARPRALALLVSVLDERRYIDSTLLGERVYAQPGFRFIAATNTGEVNGLPEFIRSRMRPLVELGFPPKEEIEELAGRVLELNGQTPELLKEFWRLWTTANRKPTPRDTIHHFALASRLAQQPVITAGNNGHGAMVGRSANSITPDSLRESFEQLFQKNLK